MFKIENIPLPEMSRGPATGGRRREYPFHLLAVGQSFVVPEDRGHSAAVAGSYYKSKHPGWDYSRRVEASGIRFFRLS